MANGDFSYFLSYEAFHRDGSVFKNHTAFDVPKRINSANVDELVKTLVEQAAYLNGWNSQYVRVAITSMFLL
jgi:hypothetical protein